MLQDDFLSLFRGQGGRLGFTIERDKFVSDVLDYAAINGLQPGCRIVQVCLYVCVFVFVCIPLQKCACNLHAYSYQFVYIIIVYLCTHTKVRYWPFCMYTTVCKLYAIICMHANVYALFAKSCCMHTNVHKLYTSMTMHVLRKLHAYCTYFVASKLYVILFITNIILS